MCKVFSCVITKSNKGYFDNKIHSHLEVQKIFESQDPELIDDKLPPDNTFGKCEITAKNGNICKPDEWVFRVDEDTVPKWWKKCHEETAWDCHAEWLKWLYSVVDVSKYPKNPFLKPAEPFERLGYSIWESIGESIGNSVLDSILGSIEDSIGDSIRESIRESIGESIGNSILESILDSIGNSIWGSGGESVWESVTESLWDSLWIHMGNMCSIEPKEGKQIISLWEKGIMPVWYRDSCHYFRSPNGDGKCEEIK